MQTRIGLGAIEGGSPEAQTAEKIEMVVPHNDP